MAEQTFFQRVFNIKPEQKNSNMMGYFGVGTEEAKKYSTDLILNNLTVNFLIACLGMCFLVVMLTSLK